MLDLERLQDRMFGQYTSADWQDVFDQVWRNASQALLTGGQVPETLIVMRDRYGRADMQAMDMTPFHGLPRERQRLMIGTALRIYKATAYALVSEGWTIMRKRQSDTDMPWGDLSKHPDRRETLVAVLVTKYAGVKLQRMALVHRLGGVQEEGVADRIEVLKDLPHTAVSGSMFELFSDRYVLPDEALRDIVAEHARLKDRAND